VAWFASLAFQNPLSSWLTGLGLAITPDRLLTGPVSNSPKAVPFYVTSVLQMSGCPRGLRVVDTNITLRIVNLVGGDGSDQVIATGFNSTEVRFFESLRQSRAVPL
jgi:hypothetical protein